MNRRPLLAVATATTLLAYAAVLLWPYDWETVGYAENRAEVLPDGGIRFSEPGIARTEAPPEWVTAAMRRSELEIQLELRSLAPEQTGPARIMTLSLDRHRRNFMIGQQDDDLVLRLRTPVSDLNGRVDEAPFASIPDVFRSMRWFTVGLRIEPGQMELSVDGRVTVHSLPADAFANWDSSYRLALGNEFTNDLTWLGEVRRAVVSAGDAEVDYATSADLEIPENVWLWSTPRLIPFQYTTTKDYVTNVIFFIPLGVLMAGWLGPRAGPAIWRAALLLAAVSAGFETLQLFLPDRSPSIDDVISNTLGGALGVLLVHWLRASAATAREGGS